MAGERGEWRILSGSPWLLFSGRPYRAIMRFAHRFNWHYAPPIYPEGDTHLWCKWCGFRQTIKGSVPLGRPKEKA